MDSSSPSADQWELVSESSTAEPLHLPNPIHHVIPHLATDSNLDTDDDDDNLSVRSLSSFVSTQSTGTAASSIVDVQRTVIPEPPSLIPQIREHQPMSNDHNELNHLIPSYVDIEGELRRQRELVAELKSELNAMTIQRNEIRNERDVFRDRVDGTEREIARLRELNATIDRQNSALRQLERNRRVKNKGRKKLQSKVASITNRKGHRRSSVSAKLRFKRQRTTHRTVYCQDRKW